MKFYSTLFLFLLPSYALSFPELLTFAEVGLHLILTITPISTQSSNFLPAKSQRISHYRGKVGAPEMKRRRKSHNTFYALTLKVTKSLLPHSICQKGVTKYSTNLLKGGVSNNLWTHFKLPENNFYLKQSYTFFKEIKKRKENTYSHLFYTYLLFLISLFLPVIHGSTQSSPWAKSNPLPIFARSMN